MDALAGQGVEIDRQGADQGLAFAGPHFGDAALVQDHAADQLHVVGALPEGPPGRFAHHGEGFFQEVVEGFALGQALAEFDRFAAQGLVGEGLHGRLQRVDAFDAGAHRLDPAVVGRAEKLLGDAEHGCRRGPGTIGGAAGNPGKSARLSAAET